MYSLPLLDCVPLVPPKTEFEVLPNNEPVGVEALLPPNIDAVVAVGVFTPKMLVSELLLAGVGVFSPADEVELTFPNIDVVVVVLATLSESPLVDAVVVTMLEVVGEEVGPVGFALILDLPPKIGDMAVALVTGVALPKILVDLPNAGVTDVPLGISVPKPSDAVELKIPPKLQIILKKLTIKQLEIHANLFHDRKFVMKQIQKIPW